MKKSMIFRTLLLSLSFGMVLAGIVLGVLKFFEFEDIQKRYPNFTRVANIPVSGLTREEAADLITKAYKTPIEIQIKDARIHANPEELGFLLETDAMLDEADLIAKKNPQLQLFWNYLWNNEIIEAVEIPLNTTVNVKDIRRYLVEEILPRYNTLPLPGQPNIATLEFSRGQDGVVVDQIALEENISSTLKSLENRNVIAQVNTIASPRSTIFHLQLMIEQAIIRAEFTGLMEIYIKAISEEPALNFAYQNGNHPEPEIAFTAASSIKIPIMISILKREQFPIREETQQLLDLMITESKNEPADKLMETVIDSFRGPLIVTEDMQSLGLKNTFLAGYFFNGAPLLNLYETPANQRADINLRPDIYNQTTPKEIGILLEAIQQCSETNSGILLEKLNGQVTKEECRLILDLLSNNKLPYLISAGLPEGVKISHKHGWIEEADGLLHTMSDSGIIYSPGGDYVMTIFVYHPDQLVFDEGNAVIAEISRIVYSYFNPTK